MSYIEELIENVEKTHKNLGNLIAISLIVIKARKLMMIVSPSGCGKSTAMYKVGKSIEGSIMPDKLSTAGLVYIADKLNGFRSSIIVDDITTTQTDYARKTTITTLAALVYTHRIQTIMQGQEFSIEEFYGSSLIGVQPIILRSLMLIDEWEGSIQDKALRYYHMYRPLSPSIGLPNVIIKNGIDIEKVNDFEPDNNNKYWHNLLDLGNSQWSRARTVEHIKDLLKGVASLENRKDVLSDDYRILSNLLKPMAIENIVVVKEQLDSERILNNTLLNLLVEYYTYNGKFTLAQIAQDYKITIKQCYKIMSAQNQYFKQVSKTPTIYEISEQLLKELEEYDLQLKQERML